MRTLRSIGIERFGASSAGSMLAAVSLVFTLIATSPALAQRSPPPISDDRDLKEYDLSAFDCLDQLEGSARTPDGEERNRLKNRSATDITHLNLDQLDVAGFLQMVRQFDAATVRKRRKDLTEPQRRELDPLEKQVVEVTGYLGLAYCGPPETTNCASIYFHDWHLELFDKPIERPPQPGDATPIICEITPRTQNAIHADHIHIQELTAFFRRADLTYEPTGHPARKIRVIGYLLWDDDHNGSADVGKIVKRISPNKYHNPWRQTAWEVHPIIKVVPVDSETHPTPSPVATDSASPPITMPESSAAPTASSTPTPTVSSTAIAAPTPSPQPHLLTITEPVTIQIGNRHLSLARGTKLEFVARDGKSVMVHYMGESCVIPIGSTDLR